MRHSETLRAVAAAFAVAALVPRSAWAAPPVGFLDAAACDSVRGWSQDPDEPPKGIAVHLYFGGPAGTPKIPAAAITADVYREDLCTAIGSCEHGFVALSPLSLHDGQARDVHAYGIDSQGGTNPELGSSPRPLMCPPAVLPGVRRKIVDVTSLDAWGFESFWDLLPLGETEADALEDGPDLPPTPVLVKADDGTEAIWLLDGGVRRSVPAEVVVPWRFDLMRVEEIPADELDAMQEGTVLRPRPVMFVRGALYLADDPQPEGRDGSTSTASSGTGSGGSGAGGGATSSGQPAEPSDDEGGSCGCQVPGHGLPGSLLAVGLGALAIGARRRARALYRPGAEGATELP